MIISLSSYLSCIEILGFIFEKRILTSVAGRKRVEKFKNMY